MKKQIKTEAEHEQGICPKCGKDDLDYSNHELDGKYLVYEWTCPHCKTEGNEVYYCNFVKHQIV